MCPFIFQEIGLNQYRQGDLFWSVLDSTVVFIMIVLQMQFITQKVPAAAPARAATTTDGEQKGTVEDDGAAAAAAAATKQADATDSLPWAAACGRCCWKSMVSTNTVFEYMMYYNMGKLTLLFAAILALCWRESVISLVLLLIVLCGLNMPAGSTNKPAWYGSWKVFFLACCVLICVMYAFQFSLFGPGLLDPASKNMTEWVGLTHLSREVPAKLHDYGEMWNAFGLPVAVIAICVLHRWSHTLKDSAEATEARWLKEEGTFTHDAATYHHTARRRQPCVVRARASARWYASVHMMYDLTMLSLVLSAFVHIDARSVVYMCFVLYAIVQGRTRSVRAFRVVYVFVSVSVFYQCLLGTRFPEGTDLQKRWSEWIVDVDTTPGMGHWLTFMNQDNKTAIFDFLVVFFSVLHARSNRTRLVGKMRTGLRSRVSALSRLARQKEAATPFAGVSAAASAGSGQEAKGEVVFEAAAAGQQQVATGVNKNDPDDFTVNTKGCCDWTLVLVHEITVPFLLAAFVLVGLANPDYGLIGLGYILCGAWRLVRFSPEPSKQYTLVDLRLVRIYNWCVLFATVVYQLPLIPLTPSFQDPLPHGPSSVYAFRYNDTCSTLLVDTDCMPNFVQGVVQMSGLPKLRAPFDPAYPGACGCNATAFEHDSEAVCGLGNAGCCAEPTCPSSFYRRRNVLGIAMFVLVSLACHVVSSPAHRHTIAAKSRRHRKSLRRALSISLMSLRRLTQTWKTLVRRKHEMDIRLRKVISLVSDWQFEAAGSGVSSSGDVWHVPQRMGPPELIDRSHETVTLRWSLPDAGESKSNTDMLSSIKGFVIEHQRPSPALLPSYSNGILIRLEDVGTDYQWVVGKLDPGSAYDFVISAVNDAGQGRHSLPLRVSTMTLTEAGIFRDDGDSEMEANMAELDGDRNGDGNDKDTGKVSEDGALGSAPVPLSADTDDNEDVTQDEASCWDSLSTWFKARAVQLAHTIETEEGMMDCINEDTDVAQQQAYGHEKNAGDDKDGDATVEHPWDMLLMHALLSQTKVIIFILVMIYVVLHSSLYALFLPVSYFMYAVWQNPRPNVFYWDVLIRYSLLIIVVRYMIQQPWICLSPNEDSSVSLTVQPWCPSTREELNQVQDFLEDPTQKVSSLHLYFFIKKPDAHFFGQQWIDVLLVLILLLHKHQLYVRGLWTAETELFESLPRSHSRLVSLVRNHGVELGGRGGGAAPQDATPWSRFWAYVGIVAPRAKKSGYLQFDVARAMALANGEIRPDDAPSRSTSVSGLASAGQDVAATDATAQTGGETKGEAKGGDDEDGEDNNAAAPSLQLHVDSTHAASSSVLVATDLNRSDRAFMNYIVDTLGPGIIVKPGKESYTLGTAAQMLTCLFLVLFYKSMTSDQNDANDPGGSAVISPDLNSFEGGQVGLILYHVTIMVLDRMALLYRNLRLKCALQALTVVFAHVYVFLTVQNYANTWIQSQGFLIIYWVLQLCFMVSGGRQIRDGYSVFPTAGQSSEASYGACNSCLYKTWRVIPMLHEMRSIFNWICAETSLDLFMWLQMDDLYAFLAITKYNMAYRKRDNLVLSGDAPQPFLWKFLYGWLLFGLLLFSIVGPIWLFSPLNPSSTPNPVSQATVTLSLKATDSTTGTTTSYSLFESEVHASVSSPLPDSPAYKCYTDPNNVYTLKLNGATDAGQGRMQQVAVPPFSDTVWSVTPNGMVEVREFLTNANMSVEVYMRYTFERQPPGIDISSDRTSKHQVDPEQRCRLAARLGATNASTFDFCQGRGDVGNSSAPQSVSLENLYPSILRLPSVAAAVPQVLSKHDFGVHIQLSGQGPQQVQDWIANPTREPTLWWRVSAEPPAAFQARPDCRKTDLPDGLFFVVFSDNSQGSVTSLLGGASVLAVYTLVLTYVATYTRSILLNPISNVPYTEMPHPDLLLEVCEGIQIMRASGYEGHRKDEVTLYYFLLNVIRSSVLLKRITDAKPKAKSE